MHSWTDAQQAAIDARRGTILVSAAAGSGKTAVLTQRIIESILDPTDPLDITDLLIVTFSRSAAAEMKSRIGDAIREKLGIDPSNKRLRRQQIALERADISTIDSFCLKIVGEGAAILGLPAGLRVADTAESKQLMQAVLDRLLEEEYRRADPAFRALTDNFITSGDRLFADKLLDLYDKSSSLPEGVGIFGIFADALEHTDRTTFLKGPFGQLLERTVAYVGAHYRYEYRSAMRYLETEELFAGPLGVFERELDYIERMTEPFASFDELSQYVLGYTAERMPGVKKDRKTPEYEATEKIRKAFTAEMKKLKETYFGALLESFSEDTDRSAKLVRTLAELLEKFDRALMSEKLRRGTVDFSDMARFAHRLLVENGQPTAFAKAVSARYRQIYIDEYQDVNRIQDEIFAAIASDNRFMVGDIKQSIYAFRGAEPSIFADYRRAFSDESNDEGRMIFLSNNFRCDRHIIDFANEVCRKLFPSRGAEVPYEKEDELCHSKLEDSPRGKPVQIALISSAEATANENPEAEYVADEIDRLIREEGYKPDEIAILLRSPNKYAPAYESALTSRGIACSSRVERPFFEEPEVLLALALLECIDNPRRDVYCSGALMSPVFGFTLNDLLGRFKVHEGECLFDLISDAEGDEQISAFLEWLEDCRIQSTRLASDEMIRLVYRSTSLPAIVSADPERGREAVQNLNKLYELAHGCEKNSFMGLHGFLQFVRDAARSGESVKSEKSGGDATAVKILSIHQSKGLEFPVCFISEAMKAANLEDSKDQLLFDKSMGMAVSLRDDSGFVHYNTLLRKMLAQKLIDSSLEEEMRVLYVALTRAKERLYITAKAKDREKLLDKCRQMRENYSAYAIQHNTAYFYWIMGALDEESACAELVLPSEKSIDEALADAPNDSEAAEEIGTEKSADSAALPDWLTARWRYTYPADRLKDLPAKLTVSTLKPDLLDEGRESMTEAVKAVEKPSFLQTGDERTPIGAERGTATHVFMQFCDFDAVEREGVNGELARLTARSFMSAAMADAVYKEALEAFFDSPLYREMREASVLKREFRFNVQLPASCFSEDQAYEALLADTQLLVQGVIDCFFVKPDGTIKLIDYKTDRIGRSPEETASHLLERYGDQLRYYRMALEALTGKRVSEVVLYSFWQSRAFAYPELLSVNSKDATGS